MGDTNDLHGYSEWSKTNDNFGSVLKLLRREHKWGTMGMDGTDVPPTASTTTVTASSSEAGSNTDPGESRIGET